MHQIKVYTITFACLALICLLGVLYNYWYGQDSGPSRESMLTSHATSGTSEEEYNSQIGHVKLGFVQPTLFVNYSILPDLEDTAATKQFLEAIHTTGNIGRNNVFQDSLERLTIAQILSNMLLKPNVQAHLRTVGLTTNMLSTEQIKECYILSKALMRDLKSMYDHASCSQEQITVINTALGRLAFLNNSFKEDLMLYQAYDRKELEGNRLSVSELLQQKPLQSDDMFQIVSTNEAQLIAPVMEPETNM